MQQGEVRLYEKGDKSLIAAFGIAATKQGKWIDIFLYFDPMVFSFNSVNNNPTSVKYHKTLCRDLRRLLKKHDRWQFGDEGSETEE